MKRGAPLGASTRLCALHDDWPAGSTAWYEYHCWESFGSTDASLWLRSHQPVTILGPCLDDDGWTLADDNLATLTDRLDAGQPRTYRVRFPDGYEATVFEDELLTDRTHATRPDPPAVRSHRRWIILGGPGGQLSARPVGARMAGQLHSDSWPVVGRVNFRRDDPDPNPRRAYKAVLVAAGWIIG